MTDISAKVMDWYATTSKAWRKMALQTILIYPLATLYAYWAHGFNPGYITWWLGYLVWGMIVLWAKNLIQAAAYRAMMDCCADNDAEASGGL